MSRFVNHKTFVIAAILIVIAIWTSMCQSDAPQPIIHPNGKAFAGSASCDQCHHDISVAHHATAHFASSQPADTLSVKGSFHAGRNVFILNDSLSAVMQRTDSGLYQVKYVHGKETMRARMDIAIGSGRKGQTYLYWSGKSLFQLPVSYYTPADAWCNSPGYPNNTLLFNRPVPGECIECHGTFLQGKLNALRNMEYDKSSLIYGIDCERCHGPAADHVAFQLANPQEKKAKFIINPASLTRQQQLDNCALCHSGVRTHMSASFAYITGDRLDDYTGPSIIADSAAPLDVHGNQYGLLRASKCFRMSPTMTCASCHDPHRNQAGDLAGYSQKCMGCHNDHTAPFCTKTDRSTTNCIDCHMPAMASKKIFMTLQGKKDPVPALIRTHLIARYSEKKLSEIKELIQNFNR